MTVKETWAIPAWAVGKLDLGSAGILDCVVTNLVLLHTLWNATVVLNRMDLCVVL